MGIRATLLSLSCVQLLSGTIWFPHIGTQAFPNVNPLLAGEVHMEAKKRGPGRPQTISATQRRAKILDAAGWLFIEDGYSSTNMETIALRCGMSKKTLYQVFESKEALLAALVCDVQSHDNQSQEASATTDVSQSLYNALLELAEWVLAPRQIGLTRLVIAESLAVPELAKRFREVAIERGRRLLRDNISQSLGKPQSGADIELLASIAFGATIADLQLRALVGEDISAYQERNSLAARIRYVVQLVSVPWIRESNSTVTRQVVDLTGECAGVGTDSGSPGG